MNAGLPTTGIGGLFYFLCVIMMFFVEIARTLRGKSSIARWKFIIEQGALLGAMLSMIWVTGFVLSKLVPPHAKQIVANLASDSSSGGVQTVFLTPFLILAVLLIFTQTFRLYLILAKKYK